MTGSASGIRAGKAYVEMYAEDDKLKQTLAADESALTAWGNRATQIGRTVTSAFTRSLEAFTKLSLRVAGGAVGLLAGLGSAGKSFADNAPELSRRKGSGIGNQELKQAEQLRNAFSTLAVSLQIAWAQVGAAVAPVLTDLLLGVSKLTQGVSRWIGANRPLIAGLFEGAKTVAIWAAGLFVAAKGVAAIVAGVALFANPLGILAAALAAGVAIWARWSESGNLAFASVRDTVQGTIGWLQERFGALYKDFQTAWAGIVAAIAKGDLATAGEIAWVTLQLTFFKAIKAMGGNWNTFYSTFLKTVALIGDAWDVLWTRLQQGWRSTQNFLAKGISTLLGVIEGKSAAERQAVWDELDAMAAADNAALEKGLLDSINKRESALSKALEALPESDEARIADLEQRLKSLSESAALNSPQQATIYKPLVNVQTQGTFNAAAYRSLQGGTALDEIKKNTKATADNTKRIASQRQPDPMQFAPGA